MIDKSIQPQVKSRNPATAHLDDTPLYVLARGKYRQPYATAAQLHRLLQRDWLSGGAVLSEQERSEIRIILERMTKVVNGVNHERLQHV